MINNDKNTGQHKVTKPFVVVLSLKLRASVQRTAVMTPQNNQDVVNIIQGDICSISIANRTIQESLRKNQKDFINVIINKIIINNTKNMTRAIGHNRTKTQNLVFVSKSIPNNLLSSHDKMSPTNK